MTQTPRSRALIGGLAVTLVSFTLVACAPEPAPVQSVAGCPQGQYVESASDLRSQLASAQPGDAIVLAPGSYEGNFVISRSGTAAAPIVLCGTAASVLDGTTIDSGYTLHLDRVAHWQIQGLSVHHGAKAIMLDGSSNNELRGIMVKDSGQEAVHLRAGSSRNLLADVRISGAGLAEPERGEGIYVGSAQSNWCEFTGCEPDRSDSNRLVDVQITGTTAEAIDIKEGTADGEVVRARLDGSAMSAADSLIDVKGNGWTIMDGRGTNAPSRGAAVFRILDGWGERNMFRGNTFEVPASGWAIELYGHARAADNVIRCDNVARVAGRTDPTRVTSGDCVS